MWIKLPLYQLQESDTSEWSNYLHFSSKSTFSFKYSDLLIDHFPAISSYV